MSKKVLHKAIPTRTLYAHGYLEGESSSLDWRKRLGDNRKILNEKWRAARLARLGAGYAVMSAKCTEPTPAVRGRHRRAGYALMSLHYPDLLRELYRPRWRCPIVKERISRATTGAAEAHVWLARNAPPQATAVECTERRYIVEGRKRAPKNFQSRPV